MGPVGLGTTRPSRVQVISVFLLSLEPSQISDLHSLADCVPRSVDPGSSVQASRDFTATALLLPLSWTGHPHNGPLTPHPAIESAPVSTSCTLNHVAELPAGAGRPHTGAGSLLLVAAADKITMSSSHRWLLSAAAAVLAAAWLIMSPAAVHATEEATGEAGAEGSSPHPAAHPPPSGPQAPPGIY